MVHRRLAPSYGPEYLRAYRSSLRRVDFTETDPVLVAGESSQLFSYRYTAPSSSAPDFGTLPLPILEEGQSDPEALWEFLVSPDTPYSLAMAAAQRCGPVFPESLIPRLLRCSIQLEEEYRLHRFATYPDCVLQPFQLDAHSGYFAGQSRRVCGSVWSVPSLPCPEPLTWDEECLAPWPWRVNKVLSATLSTVVRHFEIHSPQAWNRALSDLPCQTPADAAVLARAYQLKKGAVSLQTLVRLREVGLDPRQGEAAERMRWMFGYSTVRLDANVARNVVIADLIAGSPHYNLVGQLLFTLPHVYRPNARHTPFPAGAVLSGIERIRNMPAEELHTRVYWAQHIGRVFENPPIDPQERLDPDDPELSRHLECFLEWASGLDGYWPFELAQEARVREQLEFTQEQSFEEPISSPDQFDSWELEWNAYAAKEEFGATPATAAAKNAAMLGDFAAAAIFARQPGAFRPKFMRFWVTVLEDPALPNQNRDRILSGLHMARLSPETQIGESLVRVLKDMVMAKGCNASTNAMTALLGLGEAQFLVDCLGDELEAHPVELSILASLPVDLARERLFDVERRARQTSGLERTHALRSLAFYFLRIGEKHGVDLALEVFGMESDPNPQYRVNLFSNVTRRLHKNFGFTEYEYAPHFDGAVERLAEWWSENRESAELKTPLAVGVWPD